MSDEIISVKKKPLLQTLLGKSIETSISGSYLPRTEVFILNETRYQSICSPVMWEFRPPDIINRAEEILYTPTLIKNEPSFKIQLFSLRFRSHITTFINVITHFICGQIFGNIFFLLLCFVEIAQGCRKPANNVVFILLPINCWQRSVGQISMTNWVNFFCFDCVKTLFCFGKLIFTEQIPCLLSPDFSLVTAVTFTVA